jgi:molybdenum cofactor synthesis domain-containing protein
MPRNIRETCALCESAAARYGHGMSDTRIWTAALLIIGDEILSGRTQDANTANLAKWLNVQGIRLAEVRIVGDDMAAIGEGVNALRERNDYLFTTGGIGPTHDDITVDAIAAALGVPVVVDPQALAELEAYYATRGGLSEARKRMARVPQGAQLIENKISGAPGIQCGNIFILAGVPRIALLMLDGLVGKLQGGAPMLSRTIGCWVPESEVADLLWKIEEKHEGCKIGSYPFFREGKTGANFVIRSTSADALERCLADLSERLSATGLAPVIDGI